MPTLPTLIRRTRRGRVFPAAATPTDLGSVRIIALPEDTVIDETADFIVDTSARGTKRVPGGRLVEYVPEGSETVAGKVFVAERGNGSASPPLVPMKEDVDEGIAEVSALASQAQATGDQALTLANQAQATGEDAEELAGDAMALATSAGTAAGNALDAANDASIKADDAKATANNAKATADVAKTSADAALAAAASFPVAQFLGTITSLSQDPGLASANSGRWWQSGVAGLLTHVNAGSITVAVGDRLLSDGIAWKLYSSPPTYLPDAAVDFPKLTQPVRTRYGDKTPGNAYVWALVDAAEKLGFGITPDGTFRAKLAFNVPISNGLHLTLNPGSSNAISLGTEENVLPLNQHRLDSTLRGAFGTGGYLFAITDAADRMALSIDAAGHVAFGKFPENPEITAARGNRNSLAERLAVSMDDYGVGLTGIWNDAMLRETRQRLLSVKMGIVRQLTIACVGDSWTHYRERFVKKLAGQLRTEFGDAGAGWVGFGQLTGVGANDAADERLATCTRTGTWVYDSLFGNQNSPDICALESTTVGSKVTVNLLAAASVASSVVLHYFAQAASGTVRYRWNGGTWTSINTAGSGATRAALTGFPAGTWSLEIEVETAGTNGVRLYGVDIQSAVNGVRVHKLGSSGSKATDWLNANATQWQAGISSLAPNLVILCLGTNDQASYTAKVFQGHIENMVARIRAAAPTADILLMCPCENQGGRANPMATYAGAMRYNASVYGTAFLDLQPAFGLLPADYAFGSARPWFQADGFHPEPTTGGYAIAAALLRLLRPE